MTGVTIKTGVVHRPTEDIRQALSANKDALKIWNELTPLARNEWICYVTSCKESENQRITCSPFT